MFSRKQNIIEPNKIPYNDMVGWAIGVDYGIANPTVFLLLGLAYDGTIYVCKEYYYDGRSEAEAQGTADVQKTDLEYTNDMREFIGDAYELTGKTYREIPIIIDPSASSFKLSLRRFHIKTKNADNDVMDGIRIVSSLIAERKIIVSSECEHLIEEMFLYSWDEKRLMKTGVDAPLKQNDHCEDSLRYGVLFFEDKSLKYNKTANMGW